MTRGNRKEPIFENDDDRLDFLGLLAIASEQYGVRIYEFCLMGNHYHLLLDTPRGNLAAAMCYINGTFAKHSNWRHGRSGHLFGERYTSLVVPREHYLKRVSRYIVLNPVAAGFVRDPSEWPWSSYRAAVGIEQGPNFLYHDWRLWARHLGADRSAANISRIRATWLDARRHCGHR
jgi:REP element-mobilizing transposase RayT